MYYEYILILVSLIRVFCIRFYIYINIYLTLNTLRYFSVIIGLLEIERGGNIPFNKCRGFSEGAESQLEEAGTCLCVRAGLRVCVSVLGGLEVSRGRLAAALIESESVEHSGQRPVLRLQTLIIPPQRLHLLYLRQTLQRQTERERWKDGQRK